jgi:orotidine-5'-phosphate decarboxylase
LKDPARGVFIWCRGSNPGSADLQDLLVKADEGSIPLYQHLAQAANQWNQNNNIGLVVGATVPQQLAETRRLCPSMPFLIPGVGAQGGGLEAAVRNGVDARGRLAIINSSRGIIYASRSPDFARAARRAASRLRDTINQVLGSQGVAWP